jgi:hypothetical protein
MEWLQLALRAGQVPPHGCADVARRVLVAGGAGVLGAEVLEQLLACCGFAQVSVVVTQPINTALRGLAALPVAALGRAGDEDTALVVFDRARHANGREEAFLHPDPDELPGLAAQLMARGVRRLVVVSPQASASLPEALKHGLATRDEQAVAAMGFEHVFFVRPARSPRAIQATNTWQRVADWVLAQLQLMVPQREKPVRACKVAEFVVQVALQLPTAPAGARVVPSELVWEAAQVADMAALTRAWLHRRDDAEARVPRMRL